MKERPTKKATIRAHAKMRAQERYGLSLTTADLTAIGMMIENVKAGKMDKAFAQFVVKQSSRLSVWKLEVKSVKVQLVYDADRKVPVTFLPLDMTPYNAQERSEFRARKENAMRGDVDEQDYRSLGER